MAAGLSAVLAVVGLVLVGRHGGGVVQAWDDSVGRWFLHERRGLVGAAGVIAFVGDAPVLGALTLALAVALWSVGQRGRAFIPLVAYLGAELLVYLTRSYVHRPRPVSADFPSPGAIPGVHETSFSFPSGHATAGSAVLCSLAGLAVLTWRVRWPWAVVVFPVAAVALSRLVLGVHWFSDVAFGALVGAAWGVTVAYVLADLAWPFGPIRGNRRRPDQSEDTGQDEGPRPSGEGLLGVTDHRDRRGGVRRASRPLGGLAAR